MSPGRRRGGPGPTAPSPALWTELLIGNRGREAARPRGWRASAEAGGYELGCARGQGGREGTLRGSLSAEGTGGITEPRRVFTGVPEVAVGLGRDVFLIPARVLGRGPGGHRGCWGTWRMSGVLGSHHGTAAKEP